MNLARCRVFIFWIRALCGTLDRRTHSVNSICIWNHRACEHLLCSFVHMRCSLLFSIDGIASVLILITGAIFKDEMLFIFVSLFEKLRSACRESSLNMNL